uniref:Uncharacterized protein n=2 Tax=Phaeomonas parva TaxID=124430 RepID=A0A6U4EYR4_9STRA|mmetsp:Transcript_21787/g.66701  ORF Transcript_21787/g.66701 Transcript_21787/m.66701 type:complete len:599 (+) Transcript_21787:404-2200(+)
MFCPEVGQPLPGVDTIAKDESEAVPAKSEFGDEEAGAEGEKVDGNKFDGDKFEDENVVEELREKFETCRTQAASRCGMFQPVEFGLFSFSTNKEKQVDYAIRCLACTRVVRRGGGRNSRTGVGNWNKHFSLQSHKKSTRSFHKWVRRVQMHKFKQQQPAMPAWGTKSKDGNLDDMEGEDDMPGMPTALQIVEGDALLTSLRQAYNEEITEEKEAGVELLLDAFSREGILLDSKDHILYCSLCGKHRFQRPLSRITYGLDREIFFHCQKDGHQQALRKTRMLQMQQARAQSVRRVQEATAAARAQATDASSQGNAATVQPTPAPAGAAAYGNAATPSTSVVTPVTPQIHYVDYQQQPATASNSVLYQGNLAGAALRQVGSHNYAGTASPAPDLAALVMPQANNEYAILPDMGTASLTQQGQAPQATSQQSASQQGLASMHQQQPQQQQHQHQQQPQEQHQQVVRHMTQPVAYQQVIAAPGMAPQMTHVQPGTLLGTPHGWVAVVDLPVMPQFAAMTNIPVARPQMAQVVQQSGGTVIYANPRAATPVGILSNEAGAMQPQPIQAVMLEAPYNPNQAAQQQAPANGGQGLLNVMIPNSRS